MRHIILFDTDVRDKLLPFTYTRPVCDIRLGVLTIKEKWQLLQKEAQISFITSEHLEPLYPISIGDDNYLINGALVPTKKNADRIRALESGEAMMLGDELLAARLSRTKFEKLLVQQDLDNLKGFGVDSVEYQMLEEIIDIPQISIDQIEHDMRLLDVGVPAPAVKLLNIWGDHQVYLDPSAKIEQVFINAVDGPVYIGPDVLLMDGAKIRGPVAIGQGSIVKSHGFLSKGVSVGPFCEVGGEVKHSVLLGYSNKSHEGYLGDSVIGHWCNLGALTSNSNLRNSFTNVQIWSSESDQLKSTGKQKCGFFMGDYSRTAIHTQINSGTVIGVSCHLFGQGVAKVFIPSFTWGGISEFETYDLDKAIEAAKIFCSLKNRTLGSQAQAALQAVYHQSDVYRVANT